MLVLAAALALAPDAHACSPGPASLGTHTPAAGQVDVPVDAVIQVEIGGGYLLEEPVFTVTADGAPVEGSLTHWTRAIDLTEETGLLTFTPAASLPADAEIEVTIADIDWSGEDTVFAFATGSGATEGPPAAPLILEVSGVHNEHEGGAMSSCDTDAWRDIDLRVEPGQADGAGLSWLVVERLAEDGGAGAPFAVLGPIGTADPRSLSTLISFGVERDLSAECFTVTQVDGAGRASEPSEPLCVVPLEESWECGTTCSSVPLGATLLPGLLALVGAALRRREDLSAPR